jgi:hypothetical protein
VTVQVHGGVRDKSPTLKVIRPESTHPFILINQQLGPNIPYFSSRIITNEATSMTKGSIAIVGNI